jgi:rSAM/selenodomain-associated transferase 2
MKLLAQFPVDSTIELIFVDGGHDQALDSVVSTRPDARVIRTVQSRGHQLDSGAAKASGEWLWFLHADSRLPCGWRDVFDEASPELRGGWFRFALDSPSWQARILEQLVAWRVRVFCLPYGDQGIFVRRTTYERIGGFGHQPLMEDVAFVRKLVCDGPVAESSLELVTSARRWERDGWIRRSTKNIILLALYSLGVPVERLAKWYE